MILRFHHPDQGCGPADAGPSSRLNLLLSYGGWEEGSIAEQLPRLLSPMGVRTVRAESGKEAAEVIRTVRVHIAVVDFDLPMQEDSGAEQPAGPRILQILRRLERFPPTVVVRPRQAAWRESSRSLSQALREGAFAVLDRPVPLEAMLEVLRRILRRHYADHWPGVEDRI